MAGQAISRRLLDSSIASEAGMKAKGLREWLMGN